VPDLEGRVTALETRVDTLTTEVRHATDLGVTASREALTARAAHQQNIELLNALRMTQAEHGRTLAEHSQTLAEHTQTLAEHTQTLAEHGRTLAEHTGRFDSIDGKLGQLTLGMHTIESLLRRLIEDDGDGRAVAEDSPADRPRSSRDT